MSGSVVESLLQSNVFLVWANASLLAANVMLENQQTLSDLIARMSGNETARKVFWTGRLARQAGDRGKRNSGLRLEWELKVLRLREGMADISGGEVIAMRDGLALIH